ncbi:MAG: DNA-3-methyladenine glycosylase 2 family protein [Candidatus Eisenbacteria bacterium]|nr:DNA-3-methyladenine glycosylase 2 family protein [Candidatus Eisenbacteria bacterium]
MELNTDLCFRAVESRDRRFEGRFVLAVRSTRIYCRPGCPARLPRRANCSFYPCPAAAEEAGYRACRRCRPDTAPGTPAWAGTSASVARALRLIHRGELDRDGLPALAEQVGLGERHLRRLFLEHLGATPAAVARTRRVHFARRLLDQTELTITEIAFASGFRSIRAFNEGVRKSFGLSPTELRARRPATSHPAEAEVAAITLRLAVRTPYDWPRLLRFLRARAVPGVEQVTETSYRRTVRIGADTGWIEAAFQEATATLQLSVSASLSRHLLEIADRATHLFDLDADPEVIEQHLASDPLLRPLVRKRSGLRVPGAWEPFESAIRIVIGQQVSVAGATTLHGRLVARFGQPFTAGVPGESHERWPMLTHLTPDAATLSSADLGGLGLTSARSNTIRALATAVHRGDLVFGTIQGVEQSRTALAGIRGVGEWTAQMIALRVLREPDAFPAGDLWLRQILAVSGRPASASEAEQRSRRWSPWRAYATAHLMAEHGERDRTKKENDG